MSEWIGKIIKFDLISGHYFKGKVISEDSESLTIIDIKNSRVKVLKSQIVIIQEVFI